MWSQELMEKYKYAIITNSVFPKHLVLKSDERDMIDESKVSSSASLVLQVDNFVLPLYLSLFEILVLLFAVRAVHQ